MSRNALTLISAVLFLALPLKDSFSQEYDAGMWLSVKGEVKLNQRTTLGLTEEIRLHENFTEVGTALTDIGIEYNPGSAWRFSANYRFISRQQLDRNYLHRHRYYVDARYRYRWGIADMIAKLRWQQQFRHEEIGLYGNPDSGNYLRPEGTIRFRVNRTFRPYLSMEAFLPVSALNLRMHDKVRVTAGTRIRINAVHSVTIYYMVQQEMNVRRPGTDFIIGMGYGFSPVNFGF